MAHNASRELFIHSLLSAIHARRERGNCQLVSRNIGTFSTSIDVHSYSSNIPHTNIYYDPLSLGTPLQQFLHGNTSRPLGTLEYPYVDQPQTLCPVPATNTSLQDCQPSNSHPHDSLGPNPQSQERAESGLLSVSFCANTSTGPPPVAATANLRRDESEPQTTTLPSR